MSNTWTGFMTLEELKKFESLHSDFNKYWMPLTWFSNLASRAREEGRVRDDIALRLLMDVRSLLKNATRADLHIFYDLQIIYGSKVCVNSTAVLHLQELNNYRAKCSLLFHYDWISIPLVYTQVRSANEIWAIHLSAVHHYRLDS